MVFIDLEKTYDKVWRVLNKNGAKIAYIEIMEDMYTHVMTNVRTLRICHIIPLTFLVKVLP